MTELTTPQPLSLVIITKNAGKSLADTLAACTWIDDIVIIDSGSTDDTGTIAARYQARFIHVDWRGFGLQKRHACELAKHDWVLCLDADEVPTTTLIQDIQAILRNPTHQVYRMKRCNQFLGRYLKHGEGYPDWCVRLFHRKHAQWSDDTVHEKVETQAKIGDLKGDLLHHSAETLHQYLEKQQRYTSLQAEMLFHKGKNIGLNKLLFSPLIRFFKMYFIRWGWLDGLPGFIHISIGCYNSFLKYAKLFELQQQKSSERKPS